MLTLPRRLLVLSALMFWQGGFTFYSAVVIQVGAEVFHSHLDQGFVTQRVSNYLNLAGAAALPLLAWDVLASRDVRWRRRLRWAVWAVLAGTLALLAWMHVRLDALLDAEQFRILDRETFRAEHQRYLIVSTVQWAAGLVALALALRAWQVEDRLARVNVEQDEPARESVASET